MTYSNSVDFPKITIIYFEDLYCTNDSQLAQKPRIKLNGWKLSIATERQHSKLIWCPEYRCYCVKVLKSYLTCITCNKSYCTKHWVWFFLGKSQLGVQHSFKFWGGPSSYIVVEKYLRITCAVIRMIVYLSSLRGRCTQKFYVWTM